MKKLFWFGLALAVLAAAGPSKAQDNTTRHTIILYSSIQYQNDQSRASFYLDTAAYAGPYAFGDLGYGFERLGADFDWLRISGADADRTVIKDLGPQTWTDKVDAPWVKPLAKLNPGEHRQFILDTSANPSRVVDVWDLPAQTSGKRKPEPVPRTSPNVIKARLDHMYVIHVVDDKRDFYALLRIDSLQRGDNCTISWKLIPAPPAN